MDDSSANEAADSIASRPEKARAIGVDIPAKPGHPTDQCVEPGAHHGAEPIEDERRTTTR